MNGWHDPTEANLTLTYILELSPTELVELHSLNVRIRCNRVFVCILFKTVQTPHAVIKETHA